MIIYRQQRLTTIYIFLKIAEEKTEEKPFALEYETRKNSETFLAELTPRGEINNANIDYFNITTARDVINTWLDRKDSRFSALTRIFDRLVNSVFFIWYEILSDDPIRAFTKINLGKIQLTNAELIKALLLNKDNFSGDKENRQNEISITWDKIEQGLRDDSLWYFLNEKEQSGTRIDLLFELLAKDYNAKMPEPIPLDQEYFPFAVFSALMNADDNQKELQEFVKKLCDETDNKEKLTMKLWNDVEKLYEELRDWYSDLNKYHIIGYLIASDVELSDIFLLTRDKRKSAVMNALLETVKEKARKVDGYDLSAVIYEKNTNTRRKINNLLLLFNIATLVCKSEKQYRFPFDIYKGETKDGVKWNIEHIHATADESGEPDDRLGNLALLDEITNKLYQDEPFKMKRDIIIKRESKGQFVPLCTKNVFLKLYSTDLEKMDKWEDKDKQDYIKAMEQTLKSFFDGEFLK